jgi:DDE superfamily endonuclease
LELP